MKKFESLLLTFIAAMLILSCDTNNNISVARLELPSIPYNYNLNTTTNNNVPTLGRVLFYDPRLSANNSVSCASCHKQGLAFADNRQFSRGYQNVLTTRNSMPIQNIVSSQVILDDKGGIITFPSFNPTSLFWDGRQREINKMVLEPIHNHIEMGVNNVDMLAEKVQNLPEYPELVNAAFGSSIITKENIAEALSSFLLSIKTNNSKFDKSMRGEEMLNGLEERGKQLFFDTYNCNNCHNLQQPFNGYQNAGEGEFGGFANIGLDQNPVDIGLFKVSGDPSDIGKFKIPSLRNVALTGPYMHDGRFETIDDVLDHYSTRIQNSQNLDHRLKNETGSPKRFNIGTEDRQAIVAFLNSLTDYNVIQDPKFSNPFKY